jgi:hypothetical protein
VDGAWNIYIADTWNNRIRKVTVTTAPVCTYAITPTSATFPYTGGGGTIDVTTPAGCAWDIATASIPASMTITSPLSGSGNGTITYTIAQNNGSGERRDVFSLLRQGVVFKLNQPANTVAFSVILDPGGTISPAGDIGVLVGADQTFKLTPDPGYRVAEVIVDGVSIGASNTLKFRHLTDNHSIRVRFGRK